MLRTLNAYRDNLKNRFKEFWARQFTLDIEQVLDETKRHKWRRYITVHLGLIFIFLSCIGELGTLYIFFSNPQNQNWQAALFLLTGAAWCIFSVIAYRQAIKGNDQIALFVMVFLLWLGPPILGSLALEGFARIFNLPMLIMSFLLFALLSPSERVAEKRIIFVVLAYILLAILQIYMKPYMVPAPDLYSFNVPLPIIILTLSIFLFVSQLSRLFVSGKFLMFSMLILGCMYEAVAIYAENTLPEIHILLLILDLLTSLLAVAMLGVARFVSAPINELTLTAIRVHEGDLRIQYKVRSFDEIGVLGVTFNKMVNRLRETLEGLEDTVADRTSDLNVASEVSRQITRELDLEKLLPRLVHQTKDGFHLYYVSVFLYDAGKEELLLEVSTGSESQHTFQEAQSLYIDKGPSLVVQAARERKAVIINNVAESDSHFFNLHLPKTKAEAVFPMVVGDDLVGVLDLQADVTERFQENEIQVFTTLAEQIAIAVRNAQLYREQEHVAKELVRTDLMKSQFLASMSHELRTPLNAIINFTELVAMGLLGEVNESQKEVLSHSLNSSRHLLQLINDVLDISKIQAEKLTLFLEDNVDLYEEIRSVVEIAEPLLEKQVRLDNHSVQFTRDIDGFLPLIRCDRRRIRQVLLNLLSNAIKFTEHGNITLSVKKQTDQIVFAVFDTGPGIPPELQLQIFEPFVQTLDHTKFTEGTGLGLPISRSLVEAHGGRMWLESTLGDGSCFYFTLPFDEQTGIP